MNLLSIGGSDPSSGAGIQGDIKTFHSLNAYGLTAITAITSQNTSKFGMVEATTSEMLKSQLKLIFSDFKIDGIKIGMVFNSNIVNTIYKECKNLKIPVVLDPVLKSTTGGQLLEKTTMNNFKKFLVPLATVITPNKSEAEFLSKIKINSENSLMQAAKKIQKIGAKNVVITGLETKNNQIADFILEGTNHYIISGKKISNINHGSGCNYSSCMLFSLARGESVIEAAKFSKQFTENSIKNAKKIGTGIHITDTKNTDIIRAELSNAINKFTEIKGVYKLIPECQTNFVFSKKNPESINDVLGISGRIVKTGKNVMIAGELKYGGSKHVATALITMNKKYPAIRSAINLKYDKEIISKLKNNGMGIASYDRIDEEPKKMKIREGESIRWGIKRAVEKSKKQPDIIYHLGDIGKEPMIVIFDKTPSAIIQKILKI
jgi:hydroxymethylpyrimidine/phosphomethylpyrimidine kinase